MAFCPERPKWEQNPNRDDEHPRPFHMGVPSLATPPSPRAWFSLEYFISLTYTLDLWRLYYPLRGQQSARFGNC